MKRILLYVSALTLAALSCSKEMPVADTTLELSLPSEKTVLGEEAGGVRPLYWANGDRIAANGTVSYPLEDVPSQSKTATFSFPGTSLTQPYRITYPETIWDTDSTVILPQTAENIPLTGYKADGETAVIRYFGSVIHFGIVAGTKDSDKISYVELRSEDAQLCGKFKVDFETGLVSATEDTSSLKHGVVRKNVGASLSNVPYELFIPVPAGKFSARVRIVDVNGHYMEKSISSRTFVKGQIHAFPSFAFEPTSTLVTIDINDVQYTISGKVSGSDGKALEGVVVSDGHICTKTDSNGKYYLESSLSDVDFVFVSTPSGYAAPVTSALPVFYKRFDSLTPSADGTYNGVNFTLTKIADPDKFTMFIAADPQPRSNYATYDKIGYHSLTCCKDLYRELKETAATITDRNVYGLMLGDICHNDISLYSNYKSGMSTNGFPTYNVIGNHDHNLAAVGDKASAVEFEKVFGPTNYSFNLGGLHFIVIDNMIVSDTVRTANSGDDLSDGIRDDIWEWMANDLKQVDPACTIMLCSHSPMFNTIGDSHRSRKNRHYADMDALLAARSGKVYAWAGHTHCMYHYVNKTDPKIETHTISRAVGDLWTNDYLSNGTPRGFVVFNCENGNVSWKFHPVQYQSGSHCMTTKPSYPYRAWNYSSGKAVMKDGSGNLDERYQMNVYAPDTYASGDKAVYAVIFMWDELWSAPKFSYNGATGTMARVKTDSKYLYYDKGSYDLTKWYKTNNSTLKSYEGYEPSTTESANVFKITFTKVSGVNSGTVSVKDRFGNTYTSTVSW